MTETVTDLPEGKGDAYLFDCKIFRDGKKNSFRLDLYRSGDSLSLFARGYLGKGVMKAIVEPERIKVYFPTENEHYFGKLESLIDGECSGSIIFEEILIKLFKMTPPEIEKSYDGFYVKIGSQDNYKREYQLNSRVCRESVDLIYVKQNDRFIIDEIEFENEVETFKFMAKLRKAKIGIEIPASKMMLDIPSNSTQINKD